MFEPSELVDDSRVAGVQKEPEPVDAARVAGDAAVAEIEAEEVHVLSGDGRELVSATPAPWTGSTGRSDGAAARKRTPHPVTDRRARKPRDARDIGRRTSLIGESKDLLYAVDSVHPDRTHVRRPTGPKSPALRWNRARLKDPLRLWRNWQTR